MLLLMLGRCNKCNKPKNKCCILNKVVLHEDLVCCYTTGPVRLIHVCQCVDCSLVYIES